MLNYAFLQINANVLCKIHIRPKVLEITYTFQIYFSLIKKNNIGKNIEKKMLFTY